MQKFRSFLKNSFLFIFFSNPSWSNTAPQRFAQNQTVLEKFLFFLTLLIFTLFLIPHRKRHLSNFQIPRSFLKNMKLYFLFIFSPSNFFGFFQIHRSRKQSSPLWFAKIGTILEKYEVMCSYYFLALLSLIHFAAIFKN